MEQLQLFVLPIGDKVIFPYQSINVRIPESYDYDLNQVNQSDPGNKNIETIENLSRYGTILKITSEEKTYYNFQKEFTNSRRNTGEIKYFGALAFGRVRIIDFKQTSPFTIANCQLLTDDIPSKIEQELVNKGVISELKVNAKQYLDIIYQRQELNLSKKTLIDSEISINKLVYTLCGYLDASVIDKIKLLQIDDIQLNKYFGEKNSSLKGLHQLENKVRSEMQTDKQGLVIKKFNNTGGLFGSQQQGDDESENSKLEKRIKESKLPKNVEDVLMQEFKRLKSMRGSNQESFVVRNYIENVLDLPWNTQTEDRQDLQKAQEILDRDHSGLQFVKKRILEFLAVKSLKGNAKGTILCLAGAPGVGKTSLGKSIAECLGRPFERISLGGIRDEAQIRGIRKFYVGAMPGVLIQTMKKVKTKNPVILLDEIDKLSRDFKGDPSSALLEVLDPVQNNTFTDHYLGIPFDLSNVVFIATANTLETIQPALLDRLEVIQIPGYTSEEKREIAVKYLIPKQIQENGLKSEIIEIQKEAVDLIIQSYTSEAGVRTLERNIASVCRNVAVKFQKYQNNDNKKEFQFEKVVIDEETVREVLGVEIYDKNDIKDRINTPGIAIGMAWTQVGGKLLIIEASMSKGRGKIEITGQLGDVMKESVRTAIGWIRASAQYYNQLYETNDDVFDKYDFHIHFPAAAIPKDGPSAGVTITTALISLLTGMKVRSDLSMTGEISLKGIVLPVGGIKEKCLAAYQSGIRNIVIPIKNKKDTKELPNEIKNNVKFTYASTIEDVLMVAFEPSNTYNVLRQKIQLAKSKDLNKQSKL